MVVIAVAQFRKYNLQGFYSRQRGNVLCGVRDCDDISMEKLVEDHFPTPKICLSKDLKRAVKPRNLLIRFASGEYS